MKHRIIIILSLLTMGFIPSLAEDNYYGVALLSHQGKQTAYAADNVQAAVYAAVEGDTIHLAPGRYKEITLNKKVYIVSLSTRYTPVIYLDIPGNPAIESSLFIGDSFYVYAKCNLQSIYFTNFQGCFQVREGYRVEIVTFDRCFLWDIYFDQLNVGKLQANNCQINEFLNCHANTTVSEFKHCNIACGDLSLINATFNDCVIYYYTNGEVLTVDNCTFTNCVYDPNMFSFGDKMTLSNSYVMTQEEWDDSKENLETKGFIGTDGTVVGKYGGTSPFDGDFIPRDYPRIWRNGDLKMQGKTIIGNWGVDPTR